MPKRMSFFRTPVQYGDGSKRVTRREGWWDHAKNEPRLKPGEVFVGIRKGQGLKAGEKHEVLGRSRHISSRRERLGDITPEDVALEGFPGKSPEWFVEFYGQPADHEITRIEFEPAPMLPEDVVDMLSDEQALALRTGGDLGGVGGFEWMRDVVGIVDDHCELTEFGRDVRALLRGSE